MKRLCLVLAYVCIWSTPIQVGFLLWALGALLTTDATLLSLTNDVFLSSYLPSLHAFLKPLTYAIYPGALADFVWSLPIVLHVLVKAIGGTAFGLWLLPITKRM